MLTTEYVDNFAEFMIEAGVHFEEHFKTCEEHVSNNEALAVDPVLFQKAIDKGVANVFIIKEGEDTIGYVNVSISPSLILAGPQAVIDFLYILPAFRKEGYASEAIKAIEEELKVEGMTRLTLMLPDKDYSEPVASSLGYVKSSTIYNKYIGE